MSKQTKTSAPAFDIGEAVVEEKTEVGDGDLKRVIQLAEIMERKQLLIEETEAELKKLKAELFALEREDLPELMNELSMVDFTLESGAKVEVKKEVSAAITKANKPMALRWLMENGYGGIIKTDIGISFAADEKEAAEEAYEALKEQFQDAEMKEAVHAATLKSFVKERLEEGDDIPFDLFSVYPYNIAKIKKGKK